jgi:hypothetical protein
MVLKTLVPCPDTTTGCTTTSPATSSTTSGPATKQPEQYQYQTHVQVSDPALTPTPFTITLLVPSSLGNPAPATIHRSLDAVLDLRVKLIMAHCRVVAPLDGALSSGLMGAAAANPAANAANAKANAATYPSSSSTWRLADDDGPFSDDGEGRFVLVTDEGRGGAAAAGASSGSVPGASSGSVPGSASGEVPVCKRTCSCPCACDPPPSPSSYAVPAGLREVPATRGVWGQAAVECHLYVEEALKEVREGNERAKVAMERFLRGDEGGL